MGVHSLWRILEPTARAVRLESLNRKKMAIDASIWIYQFLKAVRDSSGSSLRKSHIVGFFRRICKLLFFGIMPVFVFDGGAPLLKRETVRKRKERRQGKREGAAKTARRLLALQIQKQQQGKSPNKKVTIVKDDNDKEEYHYLEDFNKTKDQLEQEAKSNFKSSDEYHLPDIKGFEHTKDDSRIVGDEEVQELKSIAEQVDELDGIDLNTIDPGSAEFEALPLATQYMILSQLRLRSRLRMGYSKEQLDDIFPDSKDFSKFQIQMVQKRNYFTQRLMNISGMDKTDLGSDVDSDSIRRVAGERGKSYRIQKNEGGWSLSLNDKGGSVLTAIDLEKEERKKLRERKPFERNESDEDTDEEWEDVSLEPANKERVNYSISALPLPPAASILGEGAAGATARSFSFSPSKNKPKNSKTENFETFEGDEEEEQVRRQIEAEELYEAIQRSKAELVEQQKIELGRNIQDSTKVLDTQNTGLVKGTSNPSEQDQLDDSFFDDESPFDLPSGPRQISGSELPATGRKSIPPSGLKFTGLLSEADHLLNLKLNPTTLNDAKKNPIQETSKEIPSDKKKEDKENSSKEKPKEGRVSTEQPTWFTSGFDNPYSSNSSKQKSSKLKDMDSVHVTDESGFVPYYEAKEMLKNRDDKLDDDDDDDTDDVVEVIEKPVVKIQGDLVEKKGGKSSNDSENVKTSGQIGRTNEKDQDRTELKELEEPIDYEFYESEEEELQDQLNKEEKEHEEFQKDLNPHIIKTLSIDNDQDNSEFVLLEQRKKELRDSDEVTQDMIKEVQELLACFGIPYVTAPMEAEAQCAELLNLGLVDGIVTDDSDVFLFGGDRIYKNMFHEKNYVEFYNGKDVQRDLGLDRSKFISLAQLLGSDYAEGLKGIGPVNAMEILANFQTLEKFRDWFNEGQFDLNKQSKESAFEKNLRKKLVKNEIMLDKNFPDPRINQAYLQPEVDHDKSEFIWGSPDLDKLRSFLMLNVGWQQDKADQVLVPLIKDLNSKKREGTQSTLNEFYSVDDLNYHRKKNIRPNKRLTKAKEKIKKRQKTGDT